MRSIGIKVSTNSDQATRANNRTYSQHTKRRLPKGTAKERQVSHLKKHFIKVKPTNHLAPIKKQLRFTQNTDIPAIGPLTKKNMTELFLWLCLYKLALLRVTVSSSSENKNKSTLYDKQDNN